MRTSARPSPRAPLCRQGLGPSLIVLAALTAQASTGTAQAASFTSAASGDWSDPATWGGAGVPGADDDVVVGTAHAVNYDAASSGVVKSLVLNPSKSTANPFTLERDLEVVDTLTGGHYRPLVDGGFVLSGGTLTNSGTSGTITFWRYGGTLDFAQLTHTGTYMSELHGGDTFGRITGASLNLTVRQGQDSHTGVEYSRVEGLTISDSDAAAFGFKSVSLNFDGTAQTGLDWILRWRGDHEAELEGRYGASLFVYSVPPEYGAFSAADHIFYNAADGYTYVGFDTTPPDSDGDGVTDDIDACPGFDDALDFDSDGVPDDCDSCPDDEFNDVDLDGWCADEDNCPITTNSDQSDLDFDGYGDVCDVCIGDDDTGNRDFDLYCDDEDAFPDDPDYTTDGDGDGVPDQLDQCEGYDDSFNSDGDEYPDDCDICPDDDENDADLDGWCESVDNCEDIDNADQLDTDGDSQGDACDDDDDNDGTIDAFDDFPLDATETNDLDGDGIGDNADEDDDGDGVSDVEDAFPTDGTEWEDTDLDTIGDNADGDDDNDGLADEIDLCPKEDATGYDVDGDGCFDASSWRNMRFYGTAELVSAAEGADCDPGPGDWSASTQAIGDAAYTVGATGTATEYSENYSYAWYNEAYSEWSFLDWSFTGFGGGIDLTDDFTGGVDYAGPYMPTYLEDGGREDGWIVFHGGDFISGGDDIHTGGGSATWPRVESAVFYFWSSDPTGAVICSYQGTVDGFEVLPDPVIDNDGDGVRNDYDLCEGYDDAADADGDGVADGCDDDIDGDGLLNADDCDSTDAAVGAPGTWYADTDEDGLGDPATSFLACDGAGGVANAQDACPELAPGTWDLDSDGCPDAPSGMEGGDFTINEDGSFTVVSDSGLATLDFPAGTEFGPDAQIDIVTNTWGTAITIGGVDLHGGTKSISLSMPTASSVSPDYINRDEYGPIYTTTAGLMCVYDTEPQTFCTGTNAWNVSCQTYSDCRRTNGHEFAATQQVTTRVVGGQHAQASPGTVFYGNGVARYGESDFSAAYWNGAYVRADVAYSFTPVTSAFDAPVTSGYPCTYRDRWGTVRTRTCYTTSLQTHPVEFDQLSGIDVTLSGLRHTTLIVYNDNDGDGVADFDEVELFGTDPSVADSDGDGVLDGDELALGTDANDAADSSDPDADGDGIPASQEVRAGTDPDQADSDGDGVDDHRELVDGTDGADAGDSLFADLDGDGLDDRLLDEDGDGLDAWTEAQLGTDPALADTDGDGVDDGVEASYGTDPLDGADGITVDTDGDGLDDHLDNCPLSENLDQDDTDGDALGDACDPDLDADGVDNNDDECVSDPAKTEPGDCGCGSADADADADGITDCLVEDVGMTCERAHVVWNSKGTGYAEITGRMELGGGLLAPDFRDGASGEAVGELALSVAGTSIYDQDLVYEVRDGSEGADNQEKWEMKESSRERASFRWKNSRRYDARRAADFPDVHDGESSVGWVVSRFIQADETLLRIRWNRHTVMPLSIALDGVPLLSIEQDDSMSCVEESDALTGITTTCLEERNRDFIVRSTYDVSTLRQGHGTERNHILDLHYNGDRLGDGNVMAWYQDGDASDGLDNLLYSQEAIDDGSATSVWFNAGGVYDVKVPVTGASAPEGEASVAMVVRFGGEDTTAVVDGEALCSELVREDTTSRRGVLTQVNWRLREFDEDAEGDEHEDEGLAADDDGGTCGEPAED